MVIELLSHETEAPSALAIPIAARESLQNDGFCITVVPLASMPAAMALCVKLLLAGTAMLPEMHDG
jgi:hypothetical protein